MGRQQVQLIGPFTSIWYAGQVQRLEDEKLKERLRRVEETKGETKETGEQREAIERLRSQIDTAMGVAEVYYKKLKKMMEESSHLEKQKEEIDAELILLGDAESPENRTPDIKRLTSDLAKTIELLRIAEELLEKSKQWKERFDEDKGGLLVLAGEAQGKIDEKNSLFLGL